MLLIPPDTSAPGRFALIQRVASMKSTAYRSCSGRPVATVRTFGSKMTSCAGKPASPVSRR